MNEYGNFWNNAVVHANRGSFADLEERVDNGDITREEANEIMEQRLIRAGGYDPQYDENGWPIDMRRL